MQMLECIMNIYNTRFRLFFQKLEKKTSLIQDESLVKK